MDGFQRTREMMEGGGGQDMLGDIMDCPSNISEEATVHG